MMIPQPGSADYAAQLRIRTMPKDLLRVTQRAPCG
jgi:hypothetical protein